MAEQPSFVLNRSAVLSMDCQTGIVSIYTKNDSNFLERASSILKQARTVGLTVIHVKVGFRPNLPEVSPRNLMLSAVKNHEGHRQLFEGDAGAIHPDVAVEADDIVVVKHRISAFSGTDLEMILRAKDIDTLILFGIATSGAVLATLLEAADKDYRLVVVSDCCADLDEQLHNCLVEKIFRRQAIVITARDLVDVLKSVLPT